MIHLLCAALVLVSAAAEAAERPRVPPLVEEMLRLSGVERQLVQLPESVTEGFNETAARLDTDTADRVRIILKESYRRDAMYPVLVAAVTERYDARQARLAVEAFRTPLFRRLQALEDDATGPGAAAKLRAFSEQLAEHRPSVDRHVLIRRLDTAMGATSAQLEIFASTLAAFAAAAPGSPPMRDLRTAVQEQFVVVAKNQVLLSLLLAYQTSSDDELRDYLAFWESSPGRWFVTTVNAGLVRAMTRAAETSARRIRLVAPAPPSRR
jgi:hypothetical protein